ncbi:hypothetical protein ACFL01_04990 [Planctomycetota bacterium]
MNDVRLLSSLRRRVLVSRAKQVFSESRFKAAVVIVLGLAFWAGFFVMFLDGFRFLNTFEGITTVVHDVLFSMFFVSLLIMLSFSNAIICFSSLYRSEEMEHLLSSPVSISSVLWYKFSESLAFSSWAFVLLAVPFLLAYGISTGARPVFYPMVLLFFVPFVVIAGAAGTLLTLMITACFPRNRGKILGAMVGAAVVIFGVFALGVTEWHPGEDLFSTFWMQEVLGKLAFAQNPYLPSQWIARGLMSCASGMYSEAVFYLLLLAANALFLYMVLDCAFRRWFRASWMWAQESGGGSRRRRGVGMFRLARSPGGMLLMKDLKTFVRDPVQWSQCAIIFGVLAIYILNLRTFRYHMASPFWKNLVAFLNLTATCLSLATLTTRFVFPMISLEGRRFWILGLMPLSRWDILRAKFTFVLCGSLMITITLSVLSNILLGTLAPVFVLQVVTALMVSIGLSGLAVGMGVVFPNLKESDPSKIVSGFGGTLTLVISMCYVGMVVGLVLVPCHLFMVRGVLTGQSFRFGIALSMALAAGLTIGVCCIPLWAGRRAFERMEI